MWKKILAIMTHGSCSSATMMQLSAYSSYADSQEKIPETGLKIIKYETGVSHS